MALGPPPQGGGGSDGSAHGGDMSGCPSQQHWRKPTTTLRRRWGLRRTTLYGDRRPPVRGARPGVLKDPAPQGAVTVGYVAAPGPLLCTPLLADTTADGVDAGALAFLTRAALEAEEEGGEEGAAGAGEGGEEGAACAQAGDGR